MISLRALPVIAAMGGGLLLCSPAAHANPGDLDYSFAGFGTQGVVNATGASAAMAVAPDGRIVTAGHAGIQLVLRRYLADGTPDTSFDGDGVVQLTNLAYAMGATAVAVQPDGKILVAGWAEDQSDDFLLARVGANGAVDFLFGSGGYATVDFAGQTDRAEAVLVQPDGRIVVAGTARVGGDDDFAVARFLDTGAPDASFDGDGKVTIGFGGDDACADLALQSDGRLVLAGQHAGFSDADFAVARLLVDGMLDDSFHFDGKATVGLDGSDFANAVAIQPDGKIVLAGSRDAQDGVMARFHPSGLLDDSFDGDGRLTAADGVLRDVWIQPDGRILVIGGHYDPSTDVQVAVHRLTTSGGPDPTFAGDGHAYLDLGLYDLGLGLALLPDGRILVHGTTGGDFFSQNTTLLARLWQDGTPDAGGHQVLGYPESFLGPGAKERAAGLAVQTDGRIVVAGEIAHAAGTETDVALARFLPDGEPDPDFGAVGRTTFSFHNFDVGRAVALQTDGKIVVAGHTGSGSGINFLVARFETDGSLDPTFGFFGYNVLDFFGGPDYGQAVAVAPDGKIVVAGTIYNGVRNVFGVCRFTENGILDSSFDVDGKQAHEIFVGPLHEATSVVVQDDLKIVVGGHVGFDFTLARYRENGQVDYGWGPGGQGYSVFDMGGDDAVHALALTAGGWFYAAGSRTLNGNTDFAVAQLMPNGVLATCTGFPCFNWSTGTGYVDWGGYDAAYAIDWRSDGQVVVAGCAGGQIGWAQFGPRSSAAPWLGLSDMVGQSDCAQGVGFVGVSHLVVAATQDVDGDQNLAVARFETSPDPFATAVEDRRPAPTTAGFRLHAAYPNPAMGRSVISFDLIREQAVHVVLYDAAGRQLRVLAQGPFPAGRHQRIWDGRDGQGRMVAAGVYFIEATAGAQRATQKLIVIR